MPEKKMHTVIHKHTRANFHYPVPHIHSLLRNQEGRSNAPGLEFKKGRLVWSDPPHQVHTAREATCDYQVWRRLEILHRSQ